MKKTDKKRGRPQIDQGKLSKESILNCAKALLQGSGKIPSIRKIAKELDVDPMAIYYYFSSKSELLEGVTVSLMESIYVPSTDANWEMELKKLCYSYLQLLNNYSGLLETVLAMAVAGPAQVFNDRFELIVAPLGLSEADLKNSLDLLADYLHGFALAVHCSSSDELLSEKFLDGPLSLYIKALYSSVDLDNIQ